ncbi:MAG: hypothetical protein V3S12_00190 [Acidiferrobacterales bacterium]
MACCLLVFSVGTSAARPTYRIHYTLVNTSKPKLPRRIILLPVSIEVSERSYGGVTEPVDAWSRQASRNIFRSLRRFTKRTRRTKLVKTPNFTRSEQARISEHIALYRQVVNTASAKTNNGQFTWKHKLKKFDYTIGPGLNFLRAKTSADTALFVYGEDIVSTGGRKAKATVSAIFGGATRFGYSYIHVGLVDLRTGNLLWSNKAYKSGASDLRKPTGAEKLVKEVFKDYPGIAKYRKAYVK